jgi:nicotinamidase-related amidase
MSVSAAKSAALLIVDVQVGLFRTTPPPFEGKEVIGRINSVAAKARAARVPVIFVQNDGPPDGDWLVPHTEGWQLHPDLDRRPEELVIRKSTGDAFYRTDLERTLRAAGVQSLVLMGYASEFCIDATLRNGASKDFEIYVIGDAHTTNDAPMLKAATIREYFNWVWADSPSHCGIHVLSASEIQFRDASVVQTKCVQRKRRLHSEPPEPN